MRAVSENDYQQALTALDEKLGAGFGQLRDAQSPKKVGEAISILKTSLTGERGRLGGIQPPVSTQSEHAALLDGLDKLAGDLTAGKVCAGPAAMALISRSAGAGRLRSVLSQLASASASRSHGYQIGAFLPAETADTDRRRANGETIVRSIAGGRGELTIENGGGEDAAITLTRDQTTTPVLTVYVRSRESFTAKEIPDGVYQIYITSGRDWDENARLFTRECQFYKFDEPAIFTTTSDSTGYSTTAYKITLTPVPGGDASVSPVDPESFPGH